MNQISYCVDGSYLTPQMSCADPASYPATPATSRPRSSAGFYAQDVESLNRPRSQSAGLYNAPHMDEFTFTSNAMGIKHDLVEDLHYTQSPTSVMRSPLPSNRSQAPYYPNMAGPELSINTSRLNPIPIAPNPAGLQRINTLKRGRDEESPTDAMPKRRRRSSLNTPNFELTEEERLLLRLKDEINLPWKDIALRFQLELGKSHQVPALQMRYKRLRERLRVWTDNDVRRSLLCFYLHQPHTDALHLGPSPAASTRLLGEVQVGHHCHQDARLWLWREVAGQVLHPQVGGTAPGSRHVQGEVRVGPWLSGRPDSPTTMMSQLPNSSDDLAFPFALSCSVLRHGLYQQKRSESVCTTTGTGMSYGEILFCWFGRRLPYTLDCALF